MNLNCGLPTHVLLSIRISEYSNNIYKSNNKII